MSLIKKIRQKKLINNDLFFKNCEYVKCSVYCKYVNIFII